MTTDPAAQTTAHLITPQADLPGAYQNGAQVAANQAEAAAIAIQAGGVQPGMPAPGTHGVEAIPVGHTVQFLGRTYRLTDKIPTMAVLDFAAAADKGLDTGDPAALGTMRDLLRRCFTRRPPCRNVCPVRCGCNGQIHCQPCTEAGDLAEEVRGCPQFDPGDWPRFRVHALDTAADPEQLFDVVTQVIQLTTGRPT